MMQLTRAARVDFGGIVKEVNLAFVPEAAVGDYVLVHVGFAITVIDEAEARAFSSICGRSKSSPSRERMRHEIP